MKDDLYHQCLHKLEWFFERVDLESPGVSSIPLDPQAWLFAGAKKSEPDFSASVEWLTIRRVLIEIAPMQVLRAFRREIVMTRFRRLTESQFVHLVSHFQGNNAVHRKREHHKILADAVRKLAVPFEAGHVLDFTPPERTPLPKFKRNGSGRLGFKYSKKEVEVER